jgi:hypothetical protein
MSACARHAAAPAAEPLIGALVGDPLRAIARLLAKEDRFCMGLACKMMRDHVEPAFSRLYGRAAFLRSRALAVYACDELPGFVLADTARMLGLAATVGCVAVLAELWDKRGCATLGADASCCEAAANGRLAALVWLRARGCAWHARACSAAALGGHLEVLQYLHVQGCPWIINDVCADAALGGHLAVLRYAHAERHAGCPPWDAGTCSAAAFGGSVEVLRHLHEQGCPWDSDTCLYAAQAGQLEALRYAHEHGCPWDEYTCSAAAGGGHLEVLRYAHENGCPWDEDTCREAAREMHPEVLVYAHEHGCPWDASAII